MKLNFKTYGEGAPVIILHGLFGMLDNWQSFSKKLGAHFQVFAIDQRDHGKSPHSDAFDYKLLASDLKEFIEDQQLSDVRLIGHSMGGRTIMQFALDHAALVKQMVVVDMGIKQYKGGHEHIINALQSVDIENVKSRSEVDAQLAKRIDDIGVRMFLMKNLGRHAEGGYRWKMNLDLLDKNYEDIMSWQPDKESSSVEVLFIKGMKSNYILEADKEEIAKLFIQASFVDIDAGHWIHAEKPDDMLEAVLTFFV